MRPLFWLAVLTAVLLSACGQKGALYLPEPSQHQSKAQSLSEGAAS